MSPQAFTESARLWHDFYLLAGGAAATLSGLLFVAVTFGAGLVNRDTAANARAFIDPTLTHFLNVIVTALLLVMPTMTPAVLAALLVGSAALRVASLVWVFRHYRIAHRKFGDIELSDWMMAILLPAGLVAMQLAAAWGLFAGSGSALTVLGVATGATLVLGVRSAWELLLWMAIEMSSPRQATDGDHAPEDPEPPAA